MSVTIKDIARLLNVSHTTVSRSLNDSPLISKETKDKVKEVARKYGYTPNVNARSLVLSKSYNIGLFFSTLKTGTTAHFFLDTVRGVSSVIRGQYNLAVEAVDDFKSFQTITKRNFDGIIIMSQSPKDDVFIAHVLKEEIPLVVLNREIDGQKVTTVLSDDIKGAYNATKFIIDQGHRKIAIIEGKSEFKTSQKRKIGFLNALKEAEIRFKKKFSIIGNYDIESGHAAMCYLLELEERPTAVFCSNDDMAVGAMKAIFEKGLKIPDDISLVGYDDNGFTAYLSPALTTVKRPLEQISQEGIKILLKKINEGNGTKANIIHLNTELKIRESVKKTS